MAARTSNVFLIFLGSIAALVLVAVILTWGIAAGPKASDLEAKRAEARIAVRQKLDEEARLALNSKGWVDKAAGIVHVPVTNVYASLANELKAKKPAASQVKVDPPLPMPVVDPNATEPPPSALPSAPQGADTIRFSQPAAETSAAPAPAGVTPPAGAGNQPSSLPK